MTGYFVAAHPYGNDSGAKALRIAAGIATVGRSAILRETLMEVRNPSRTSDRLVICATQASDVEGTKPEAPHETMVLTSPGLPRQRNKIPEMAQDCDILLFIDEDFLLAPNYLAETIVAFEEKPEMDVATGTVLADGITGTGLTAAEGRRILEADARLPPSKRTPRPAFSGYGCNMAIRTSVAFREGIRVDERLPLYTWQKDVDFTRQLGRFGKLGWLPAARGVHLGTKLGRGSGRRLGYSQVANPFYPTRKPNQGVYPAPYAARRIFGNFGANLLRAVWQEPHVDRRGRLRGNLLALGDLMRGKTAPECALDL
jgi:hypothetical protein